MGKGISLILLQMMAMEEAKAFGTVGKKSRLVLADLEDEPLFSLKDYFRPHLIRLAEKSINDLRTFFEDREDLVENGEMIRAFVDGALNSLRPTTDFNSLKRAGLIFEAIVEDEKAKTSVLKQLAAISPQDAVFLTNTSSIPIGRLAEKSGLKGRLVGAHFYNPPPVQKLLEMIFPEGIDPEAKRAALEIGEKLKKTVVISEDVPGFIGNGHFLREIHLACCLYDKFRKTHSHVESILMVEAITRDFLVRPMGMFQLLDYVGLDVGEKIAEVMDVPFHGLLKKMIEEGKVGGQNLDGSQKEGFFRYEKGKITATYDLEKGEYVERVQADSTGDLPRSHKPWKEMMRHPETLEEYEKALRQSASLGAKEGARFLDQSRAIAKKLVDDGVAQSLKDVHTVLRNGFYHVLV